MNTINGGFNNARSINTGSFLQSNVQTNKDQGQELSTLDDGSKIKPTQPVISFVIPSYASGIMHLLDLNGKLPKIQVPSDELLPPIGLKSPINNDNERERESQTLPNFISTTIVPSFPFAVSLSSKTNTEATAIQVTVRPTKKLTVAHVNSSFQTTAFTTAPTIESTKSANPRILFTTNLSEPKNTTTISQQIFLSTDSLQETTTLSPESWRRLLILGEQKTPGYAIRSDGSIDPNIAFPYTKVASTTIVPGSGFELFSFGAIPIMLPVLEKTTINSLPQTTFANLNDVPFLPPLPVKTSVVNNQFNTQNGIINKTSNELSELRVNNLFQTTHSPLFANNVFSTSANSEPLKYTNPSSTFAASEYTVSGFQKSTTSSPVARNQPTHSSFFPKTTRTESIFTSTEVLKESPNAYPLSRFETNFASNVPGKQPPKVQNGFGISKNIAVPDNNPFQPPLPPMNGIVMPNFAFKNQVNNPENILTTSLSSVNQLASSTETSIIDSYPSTSKPFTRGPRFRSSNDCSNNQTFDNATTTLTDRISNSNEMTTTETSNSTMMEKSTMLSTFFEPVTDSIVVKTPLNDLLPPIFPNNDLIPPLSSESSINDRTNSSFEISNNPFLPKLDLNPFLAPFSSNLAQTVPQQSSSIPSLDVSTTKEPHQQSYSPTKFDNKALQKKILAAPITQVNGFKYTGGFGAPLGILSPHNRNFNK